MENKIENVLDKCTELSNEAYFGFINLLGNIRYAIMGLIAVPSIIFAIKTIQSFDTQQLVIGGIALASIILCGAIPLVFGKEE